MEEIKLQCKKSGKEFLVNDWEQKFLQEMGFPLPTMCAEERLRRRLSYRNERKIYRDKCDLTGKPVISLYSEDKPYTVYSQEAWWGDDWDPKKYGQDFDFSRTFFEQFQELQLKVPRLALMNTRAENSEYCNITTSNKNCYLVFGGDFCEDCMYSCFCMHSQNCADVYWANGCTLCYDVVDCEKCYDLRYAQNCNNCSNSAFLHECRGCKNCFGCVGLINKQYNIFNQQYSKEDYEEKLKEFRLDSFAFVQGMKAQLEEFRLKFPHRFAHIINCENVSGDELMNAKNCENCFDICGPAEDLKDVYLGGWDIKDMMSCDHVGHKAERFYEMLGSISGYNCAFSTFSWYSNDIFYSDMIGTKSAHLFGCSNMKKAQYCILNKQYEESEYFIMKEKIVAHMKETGEWGEFFPMKNSPWAYNETVAQDLFPMSKEECLAEGLKWYEEEKKDLASGMAMPDSINQVTEEILNQSFVCEKSGRPYKINATELSFYKKLGIPLPRLAPETRNEIHIGLRNPRKIWQRQCAKCGLSLSTSFSHDRPEIIYCDKCYQEATM